MQQYFKNLLIFLAALLALAAVLACFSVLLDNSASTRIVPTVQPVALPPITDQPEAMTGENERIRVRQQCLITSWSHMNELAVHMRGEYAQQILKACGLQ
jgi:hypothetical protein